MRTLPALLALFAVSCGKLEAAQTPPDAAPAPVSASPSPPVLTQLFEDAAAIAAKGEPWLGGALRSDAIGLGTTHAKGDDFAATGRADQGVESGDLDVHAARDFSAITFAVGGASRLSFTLRPDAAKQTSGALVGKRVAYPAVYPSTDALLVSGARFADLSFVLRDARAPSAFTFVIERAKGLAAPRLEDGALVFADGKGQIVLRMPPPFAVDANGRKVTAPLALEGDGDRVTIRLDTTGLAYPIVLDPAVEVPVWTLKATGSPSYSYNARLAYLNHKMYKVGGRTAAGVYSNIVLAYDPAGVILWGKAPGSLGTMPGASREDASVAVHSDGVSEMLVANGFDGTAYLDDYATFKTAGGVWSTPTATGAGARSGAPLAHVSITLPGPLGLGFTSYFMHGGGVDDLWRFRSGSWVSLSASGTHPPVRSDHALVFSPDTDRLIVFGGVYGSTVYNDTYSLSISVPSGPGEPTYTWSAVCGAGGKPACAIPARQLFAYARDPFRKRIIVATGIAGATLYADTWEFDETAGTWTALCGTAATPACDASFASRRGAAMAFDTDRRVAVMIGGYQDTTGTGLDETWEYFVRGNACTTSADCDAGSCIDGVCCKSAACGTCQACNLAGSAGTCTNVPSGASDPDSCTTATSQCNGGGKCVLKQGQPCDVTKLGADCASGFCTDGFCCDRACNGACDACSAAMGGTTNGTCKQVTGSPGKTRCGAALCSGSSDDCPGGCTTDAECSASTFCDATGACKPRKALGNACNVATDCKVSGCRECLAPDGSTATGYCTDGVCCDGGCTGLCQGCSAARKGTATEDGKCGNVKDGLADRLARCVDSRKTSPLSCTQNGVCNGAGACSYYSKATSCDTAATCLAGNLASGKFCDGTGTCAPAGMTNKCDPYLCKTGVGCPTTCATSADCSSGFFCDDDKKCKAKLAPGAACLKDVECPDSNPYCTDGVCCNQPCDGQCEYCTNKGACIPNAEPPKGARAACETSPDVCKSKTCDGVERKSCQGYATSAVKCREASCVDGKQSAEARCDGKGNCGEGAPVSCGRYLCGGTTCKTACATKADCVAPSVCNATGQCVETAVCGADGHTLTAADGSTTDCAPYKCSVEGACQKPCTSSDGCVDGNLCDTATGACAPLPATSDAGGCALGSRGAHLESFGVVAALMMLGARRRRRR